MCITQLQHAPDLTSSTSWQQQEEEDEDKEGFQGWELCPMYQPWAQRADMSRAAAQTAPPSPPCSGSCFQPLAPGHGLQPLPVGFNTQRL